MNSKDSPSEFHKFDEVGEAKSSSTDCVAQGNCQSSRKAQAAGEKLRPFA